MKFVILLIDNPIIPYDLLKNELKTGHTSKMVKCFLTEQVLPRHTQIFKFKKTSLHSSEVVDLDRPSMLGGFKDTNYFIYLSSNELLCFSSKTHCHIAKNCCTDHTSKVSSNERPITDLSCTKSFQQHLVQKS